MCVASSLCTLCLKNHPSVPALHLLLCSGTHLRQACVSPQVWRWAPRRRCPSLSITESRASNGLNSKSSVPAQRIQSQATRKSTQEVPSGLTQGGRLPMEEGIMSTLQIWQPLQGRSHSLDWLASKTISVSGTSDANACIALFFFFFSHHH